MRYQTALRVIGKWLDERATSGVTAIEIDDGFLVRWDRGDVRLAVTRHFRDNELLAMERAARGGKAAASAQSLNGSTSRGQYQDALRAMGYEVDQAAGETLLLQEVEGGMLVTYQYPQRSTSGGWRKHMAILPRSEQQSLVAEARRRRQVKTGLAARMG